ncbi:Gfo/Idh/MocA family oxidoreductase [bacterium]|nr:Gfo/Idh/MocA family oxidoreductase [bacterium]
MRKLGVGVVGCGAIGPAHAQAANELEETKLIAVCDKVEEKARSLAQRFSVDWYTDYDKMLEREDIDVVCICVPSGMHAEFGIKAAKARKHIICEKPLDITLENCDALIKSARENRVKLGGIFQRRFMEDIRLMKKLVEEGKLGKIAIADMDMKIYRSQAYYDSGEWRGTWALDGGGCLMNQGVHFVDSLLWIMGPVEWVEAEIATLAHNIEVEDTAVAILKFKNGALGAIKATTSAYLDVGTQLSIGGYQGSVVWEETGEPGRISFLKIEGLDEKEILANLERGREETSKASPIPFTSGSEWLRLHLLNFRDIIRAIIEDREPLITGEEARKAVELILAIYESAKTNKRVYLPLEK